MKTSFCLCPAFFLALALGLPALADDIHSAAREGELAKVEQLVSTNRSLVNLPNRDGYTPLHFAAIGGKVAVLEFLLNSGAEINATNKSGHPPVFCALHAGQFETASVLIRSNADLSGTDSYGSRAIHQAARSGNTNLLNLVLNHGCAIDAKEAQHGQTCLHALAISGNLEGLALLIQRKADLNAADKNGNTPLHLAAQSGKLQSARILIEAAANPNVRNKLGFKPVDLVRGKENDALAQLLAQHTASKWQETGAGTVGETGDPSLLLFEGNQVIATTALREALRANPSYLLAAYPQAQRKPFLELLEKKVVGGYRASGFPDASAQVTYDEGLQRIRVKVTEGQRYSAGQVTVTGAKGHMATDIKKWLTTRPEPDVGRVLQIDTNPGDDPGLTPTNSNEVRVSLRATCNKTEPSQIAPLWVPGEPASFDPTLLQRIETVVRGAIAESGYFFPRIDIKRNPIPTSGKANLSIAVLDPGPPGVIVDIQVEGNERNTRAEVLNYLGLHSGRRIDRKLFQELDARLSNSGRFLDWVITPESAHRRGNALGGVRLHLWLREYKAAPTLFARLSPEQEILLKCGRWLGDFKKRSEDFVASATIPADTFLPMEVSASIIISPAGELLFKVDPSSSGFPPIALLASKGVGGLYCANSQTKFEATNPDVAMQLMFSVTAAQAPSSNNWNLGMSWGIRGSREDKHSPPAHFSLTVLPAAMMSLSECRICNVANGKLMVRDNRALMTIDARTGRLEHLSVADEGATAEVHFERGAFAQASKSLLQETSKLRNKYVPGQGISTLATFLAGQALQISGIGRTNVSEEARRRAASALEKLSSNSLFGPIDMVFQPEPDDHRFGLPADAVDIALAQNSMAAMFSGVAFSYCDKIFPRYSWPWTLARESVFILADQSIYADAELNRLHGSDQTGPIGSLVIAKFLQRLDPTSAKSFALRGLSRLAAEDFAKDCELLLKPGGSLAETFARFADNLRTLSDEEVQALAAVIPEDEARLLRAAATALKENPAHPLSVSLGPVLESYWNQSLRTRLRAALQNIAFPQPPPGTFEKL